MLLLFNVRITSQALNRYHRASWLPDYSRFDIFRYTLASYTSFAALTDRAVFYIQLDPEFADRQAELEEYIYTLYPNCILRWSRCYYARDWRSRFDADLADSDVIWLAGNDDHVWVDYNTEVLESGLRLLRADDNPMSVLYYSHWPEQMNMQALQKARLSECGNWVVSDWRNYDSIQVLKTQRFRSYWFDQDWGDLPVFRTDELWNQGHNIVAPLYSPTRPLVHHYDGYSHVGCPATHAPPLFIPPGFFEGEMKIRFGYADRREGWVNVNPELPYWAANSSGADHRCVLAKLPAFWQELGQVVETDVNPDLNMLDMGRASDAAFLESTHAPMSCWGVGFSGAEFAPRNWFKNHLIHG